MRQSRSLGILPLVILVTMVLSSCVSGVGLDEREPIVEVRCSYPDSLPGIMICSWVPIDSLPPWVPVDTLLVGSSRTFGGIGAPLP